jgi:hypothetical protein
LGRGMPSIKMHKQIKYKLNKIFIIRKIFGVILLVPTIPEDDIYRLNNLGEHVWNCIVMKPYCSFQDIMNYCLDNNVQIDLLEIKINQFLVPLLTKQIIEAINE